MRRISPANRVAPRGDLSSRCHPFFPVLQGEDALKPRRRERVQGPGKLTACPVRSIHKNIWSRGGPFVKTRLMGLMTAAVLLAAVAAGAQDRASGAGDGKKPAAEPPPKAEQSATQHRIAIGGKTINYTATAGTLLLR